MYIRALPASWPSCRDRFDALVSRSAPEGCWTWLGHSNRWGRGLFRIEGGKYLAPRVAWALANGLDPGDRYVLHSCDRPSCVNPSHLRLGSASDNQRDAVTKGRHFSTAKQECKAGHPFTEENTYINPRGERQCRRCNRRRRLAHQQRVLNATQEGVCNASS